MSDKRKTLTLPAKEAHDPRFGIFVAALFAELERRRGQDVTFFALSRAVEAARQEAFGD